MDEDPTKTTFFIELGQRVFVPPRSYGSRRNSTTTFKLLRVAQELEYPIVCLALCLQMHQMHMAPRFMKAREAYAFALPTANGIIAG
jgi:hypothetical protein